MTRILAIGLITGASVVLAASASAQPKFDSEVTIKAPVATMSGAQFSGKVKSDKGACEPKRKVVLYSDTMASGGDSTKVGTDETNAKGEWKVTVAELNPPYYHAEVKERDIAAGLCKSDKSQELTII